MTRTSNSSPIPNIDQLSHDKEYLGEDNNEEEDDDDDDSDTQKRLENVILHQADKLKKELVVFNFTITKIC